MRGIPPATRLHTSHADVNAFDTDALRLLDEVARSGSFTAAAELLGYTQSAVSRRVAALERAAGGPLFERLPEGVRLTPAGRALHRHALDVLDRLVRAGRGAGRDPRRQRRDGCASARSPPPTSSWCPRAEALRRPASPRSSCGSSRGSAARLTEPAARRRAGRRGDQRLPGGPARRRRGGAAELVEDGCWSRCPATTGWPPGASVDLRELAGSETWIEARAARAADDARRGLRSRRVHAAQRAAGRRMDGQVRVRGRRARGHAGARTGGAGRTP